MILVVVTGLVTLIVCSIAGLGFLVPRLNLITTTSEAQPTATTWPPTPTRRLPRALDPTVSAYADRIEAIHKRFWAVDERFYKLNQRFLENPYVLRDPAWMDEATAVMKERIAVCRDLGSATDVPPEFAGYDLWAKCTATECMLATRDFGKAIVELDPVAIDTMIMHEKQATECWGRALPELHRVRREIVQ